jgi:hypothetical protein
MFSLELSFPEAEIVVSALRDKRTEVDRNLKYAYESLYKGKKSAWSERDIKKYLSDHESIDSILSLFGFSPTEPPERPEPEPETPDAEIVSINGE